MACPPTGERGELVAARSGLPVSRCDVLDVRVLPLDPVVLASLYGLRGHLPAPRHLRHGEDRLDPVLHLAAVPGSVHLPDLTGTAHGRAEHGPSPGAAGGHGSVRA